MIYLFHQFIILKKSNIKSILRYSYSTKIYKYISLKISKLLFHFLNNTLLNIYDIIHIYMHIHILKKTKKKKKTIRQIFWNINLHNLYEDRVRILVDLLIYIKQIIWKPKFIAYIMKINECLKSSLYLFWV